MDPLSCLVVCIDKPLPHVGFEEASEVEGDLAVRGEVGDLRERCCIVAAEVVDEHGDSLEDVALFNCTVGVAVELLLIFLEPRKECEQ